MSNRKTQYRHHVKSRRWIEQNGLCYYCEVEMIHWEQLWKDPELRKKHHVRKHPKYGNWISKSVPKTLATLEHLRDRYDPTRNDPPRNNEKRLVLACYECNHKRGAERTAEQPIEELRKRAQNGRGSKGFDPVLWEKHVQRIKKEQEALDSKREHSGLLAARLSEAFGNTDNASSSS